MLCLCGTFFLIVALIAEFENNVDELENANLIKTVKNGCVIERIYMVLENVSFYHKLIGAADKRYELKYCEDILKSFMGRSSVLDNICSSQLERIKNYQLPNIARGC